MNGRNQSIRSGRGVTKDLTFGLLPATGLQAAIGVDEEVVGADEGQHVLDPIFDLLLAGNTRRVDVVDTRANVVLVAELLEGTKQLHVALGGFDGDDIGIETLDGREDVVEVGVAEVGVGLSVVTNTGGGQTEGVDSPGEVAVPIAAAEWQLRGRSCVRYSQQEDHD